MVPGPVMSSDFDSATTPSDPLALIGRRFPMSAQLRPRL